MVATFAARSNYKEHLMTDIKPLDITSNRQDIADLRERLGRTRWPDAETPDDWSQGIPLAYVGEGALSFRNRHRRCAPGMMM